MILVVHYLVTAIIGNLHLHVSVAVEIITTIRLLLKVGTVLPIQTVFMQINRNQNQLATNQNLIHSYY